MNAVYPLGTESLICNWEIEHSIKLLQKFAPWVDDFYTVGEAVPFAKNLPMEETQHPAVNIWEKCLTACLDEKVSDPFLFLSDDHFVIKPIPKDYPAYYSYPISEYPFKPGFKQMPHPYYTLVKRTEAVLGPVLFYNVHCPVVVHKDKFITTFEKYRNEIYTDCGLLVKTTYLAGTNGVQMNDYKTKAAEPYDSVKFHCKDRHVFSTYMQLSEGAEKFILEMLK